MKKIFLFLFFLITANISRAQNEIVVDPNASLRTLSGNFSTIKISGGIDLYLSQSDDVAIAVSAAEEKYTVRKLNAFITAVQKRTSDCTTYSKGNETSQNRRDCTLRIIK